ncbi:hypothetical protein [Klebsiella variicola]|uniref:hypothetical protein n=1 Tax=Klebsiella variicola TaxID=244366 RepID=UPI003972973F|nr:hypothetical protein [Klebsiella variicola subsp. variicola]
MEWEVCDVIYSQENDTYLLKLYSGPLVMMAEVVSIAPIFKADMLYPIKDAKYLVNKNESRPVKVYVPHSILLLTGFLKRKYIVVNPVGSLCSLPLELRRTSEFMSFKVIFMSI